MFVLNSKSNYFKSINWTKDVFTNFCKIWSGNHNFTYS